jgi:hypothetical protein
VQSPRCGFREIRIRIHGAPIRINLANTPIAATTALVARFDPVQKRNSIGYYGETLIALHR